MIRVEHRKVWMACLEVKGICLNNADGFRDHIRNTSMMYAHLLVRVFGILERTVLGYTLERGSFLTLTR
jgi:hypothetical protein